MTTMKAEKNPARYRDLSKPFENYDVANKALSAFYDELSELRQKHKIANVYVILKVNAVGEDGEEGEALSSMHMGSGLEAESLCAWAYGREQSRREQAIAALLKDGGKRK